ncbi:unnamed protein product, partial [marine sediment metagenome]
WHTLYTQASNALWRLEDDVENILEDAVVLSKTWSGGKKRKALRAKIVKPLRRTIRA